MGYLKNKYLLIGVSFALLLGIVLFVFFDAYKGYRFRTTQNEIPPGQSVNLTGLRDIKASGGNLPRFPHLQWNMRHIKDPIIIVNGHDSGTKYVKGLPVTLLGYYSKKPSLRHYIRRILITGTTEVRPELVTSEADEAKKYGWGYKSLYIGSRFTTPDPNVDEIVNFFDSLPKNIWLHFHCAHGSGRTTMLIVMLDIMRNAPQVSLIDIAKRHYILGYVDLLDTEVWPDGNYTAEMLKGRKDFIEKFYAFIVQRKAGGIQIWSEWHRKHMQGMLTLTPPATPLQTKL